jgi:glycosyltransferase involved in cell wall biosynthesis
MAHPKITIVTPSFNQAEYLEQCIESVLSQNYPNLEYIIIDGGSTDKSVEIIKKNEKHLKYWISEPDLGQSDAINKGLKLVTGEIFNWLCSDDYLENGALKLIGETFSNSNIDVISGNIRVFDHLGMNIISNGTKIEDSLQKTLALSVNVQPSTFFRTKFITQANGINNLLHYFMDKELWMKYLLYNGQDKFYYLDNLIAHYRIQQDSKTHKEMDNEMLRPDSGFKIDNNTIYYSLATQTDLIAQSKLIKTFTNTLLPDYTFSIKLDSKKQEIIRSSIQYYLYNEAKKWFYKGQKKKALRILIHIKTSFLDNQTKNDYYYLLRKSIISII